MKSRERLCGFTAAAGLEVSLLGMLALGNLRSQVPAFFVLFAGTTGAYWVGTRCRRHFSLRTLLIFGLMFRLTLLFLLPTLSDDIYRYAWDGRMQLSGINPYLYAPSDLRIFHLRDSAIYPHINHADLPTIYPPFAQLFFLLGYALAQSIWGIKLLVAGVDLLVGWLLIRLIELRKGDARDAVFYFWHPLVLLEGAGHGHIDLLGIAGLMLALFWWRRARRVAAFGALGSAVLAKFLPAAFLPGFIRTTGKGGRLTGLAVFGGIILIGYVPYTLSGAPVGGSLGIYMAQWEFNGPVFRCLRWLLGSGEIARIAIGCVFGLFILGMTWRRCSPMQMCYWGTGAFLALTPTLHPWYGLWITPFLALYKSAAWTAFSLSMVLSYYVLIRYVSEGVWIESNWIIAAEFGIPICVALWTFLSRSRSAVIR